MAEVGFSYSLKQLAVLDFSLSLVPTSCLLCLPKVQVLGLQSHVFKLFDLLCPIDVVFWVSVFRSCSVLASDFWHFNCKHGRILSGLFSRCGMLRMQIMSMTQFHSCKCYQNQQHQRDNVPFYRQNRNIDNAKLP